MIGFYRAHSFLPVSDTWFLGKEGAGQWSSGSAPQCGVEAWLPHTQLGHLCSKNEDPVHKIFFKNYCGAKSSFSSHLPESTSKVNTLIL